MQSYKPLLKALNISNDILESCKYKMLDYLCWFINIKSLELLLGS